MRIPSFRVARFTDADFLLLFFGTPIVVLTIAGFLIYRYVDFRMRGEKAACRHGDAAACTQVGEAYIEDGGQHPNNDFAVDYFERACTLGVARSCLRLAWVRTHGSTLDYTKAVAAWEQACVGGVAQGCKEAADVYDIGVSIGDAYIPADAAKARALYDRACAAGLTEACK
jgi:TPR repeat protein